ncbi:MAG TPA: serine/threonine-protein kinase [Woeseiaceae bacterium]|nr:serine/threonine-protein kinase [Woeseiaceae bacterium]
MEPSRHALRRNSPTIDQLPGGVDLPSYGADELSDLQASDLQPSEPMPDRASGVVDLDRETTEALGTSGPAQEPKEALLPGSSRKPLERTQPIKLACFAGVRRPGRDAADLPRIAIAAPARTGPPAPGDVLCDRYVVAEKIDHYGMGLVYKARDRQREQAGSTMPWVALKFARPCAETAEETSRCLRQEFLKLSQLNHPNVVKVYDLASDRGIEFIVMEWLSGETLSSLLARITARRIALEKAIEIVRCTARGLAHAHDLGIVHGDVKPSNIFLTNSRAVKILDFGSSGSTTPDDAAADGERNWATRAYASPDVLQGEAPQPHDDVFALGVTAWCLLAGDRPFGERDALAARDEGLEPPRLPPDAHEQWPAVRHALQFAAIDRPANAKAFLQEFDARGDVDTPALRQPHGSPTVAYGAVVATLLASVVWWSVQSVSGPPTDAQAALANGNAALAEGRLMEPEGESAWSWYSAVLDADPGNRYAIDGMEEIADRYIAGAREHALAGDVAAARRDLDRAEQVSPDHVGIALVEDVIARQGRDFLLRARHAAETDLAQAEALLREAENLLSPDDPQLTRVREDLVRQRTSNRVDVLLREIDDRILSERLTMPRGDSAVDLLRRVQELAPDDRNVTLAAERIVTALLFQAMFAISNSELDDAAHYLATARDMGIQHLALARAEYELAKARRAALSAP